MASRAYQEYSISCPEIRKHLDDVSMSIPGLGVDRHLFQYSTANFSCELSKILEGDYAYVRRIIPLVWQLFGDRSIAARE